MKFANQLSLVAIVGLVCFICYIEAQLTPSDLVDLGTPEDDLVDAALEHEEVADRCLLLKERLDVARADGLPVDPRIQQKMIDCMRFLGDLEEDIEKLADTIIHEEEAEALQEQL